LRSGFALEYVNCNLCGGEDFKFLYKQSDRRYFVSDFEFSVVQCRSCGLAFVNPRPTIESMSAFYPKKFYQKRDLEHQRARCEEEAKYLEGFKPGRVLDVGCARGAFLKLLRDKGWEVYGMDYSDEGNPHNLDLRYGDLQDIQYPSAYFDVVTAWAVFEHLHDPMRYFKEVARILKPGGHFIFLVTNINSLWSRYGHGEDVPRHLYFFSEKTLSGYADKSDLLLVKVDFSNDIYSGTARNIFRINLLRWAGVSWRDINKRQPSFLLRVLAQLGSLAGDWLIWPSVEIFLRRSGIMIATMKKQ
jgi:SAM-dependent methyltransferase